MKISKKISFLLSIFLFINPVFAQTIDDALKTDPMLELGTSIKTLGLRSNVKEMQEKKFSIDKKGNKTDIQELFSNKYKFDQNGLNIEFEQNYSDSLSIKNFFSYTNKGYISHIDIETTDLSKDKDTSNTNLTIQFAEPKFSTVDYKYVIKKNILYKAEERIEGPLKKINTRNGYFYHFNDENQIAQIDYQTTDFVTKYFYDSNGIVKEVHHLKSGVLLNKYIYKYDTNNNLIKIASINTNNNTKYPNEEIAIGYKFDTKGNIIEKKVQAYLYSPNGTRDFFEGCLYLYNYSY